MRKGRRTRIFRESAARRLKKTPGTRRALTTYRDWRLSRGLQALERLLVNLPSNLPAAILWCVTSAP